MCGQEVKLRPPAQLSGVSSRRRTNVGAGTMGTANSDALERPVRRTLRFRSREPYCFLVPVSSACVGLPAGSRRFRGRAVLVIKVGPNGARCRCIGPLKIWQMILPYVHRSPSICVVIRIECSCGLGSPALF